jgi:acetyltransferase-like isoleucine patch superfamily enzyme
MNKDLIGRIFKKLRYLKLNFLKSIISPTVTVFFKIKGVQLSWNNFFYGFPIVYREPNSEISIGNNVTFRSDKSSNLFGTFKKCTIATLSEGASLSIGHNCGISAASITSFKKVTIGNNVLIGANVIITDSDWHGISVEKRREEGVSKAVIIGNGVWLGANSLILKGVTIGDNSVIGAGSVVSKNIPADVIAAGNPCVVLKQLND